MTAPSIATIFTAVAAETGISREEMIRASCDPQIVLARRITMWLIRRMRGWSPAKIGLTQFGKDRGTVVAAFRAIDARIEVDPEFRAVLERLEAMCRRSQSDENLETKLSNLRAQAQQLQQGITQLVEEAEALRPLCRRKKD